MVIAFYSRNQDYAWLSNFSPHGFQLDGQYWATVEHYFQAAKFLETDPDYAQQIRQATGPSQAKRLGRSRAHPLREDWEDVKEAVMRRAIHAKFTTHADLKTSLLETGDEELMENAPADYYWGCGRTGTGRNRLGVILMEVRSFLRVELCLEAAHSNSPNGGGR